MIQAAHPLTVTRRCELLDVARATVYYHPTGIPSEDLALMRLLDEIHLERPFYGSRRLRDELETQGHPVNRKRVQRLMRQMGLSRSGPRNLDSGLSEIPIVFQAAVPKLVASKYTTSGVRRPSEL